MKGFGLAVLALTLAACSSQEGSRALEVTGIESQDRQVAFKGKAEIFDLFAGDGGEKASVDFLLEMKTETEASLTIDRANRLQSKHRLTTTTMRCPGCFKIADEHQDAVDIEIRNWELVQDFTYDGKPARFLSSVKIDDVEKNHDILHLDYDDLNKLMDQSKVYIGSRGILDFNAVTTADQELALLKVNTVVYLMKRTGLPRCLGCVGIYSLYNRETDEVSPEVVISLNDARGDLTLVVERFFE